MPAVDPDALPPGSTPTRPAALASAEADCYRDLLARVLPALEAAATDDDPTEAVPDLPALVGELRRVLGRPTPPAPGPLSAPLAGLLAQCRLRVRAHRRAIYDMKVRASTARTAQAAAYWRRRAAEAVKKPDPWREWATALHRVRTGGLPVREHLHGLLRYCTQQLRRCHRAEARAAEVSRAKARARRVRWEVRGAAVEEVLVGLVARGPDGGASVPGGSPAS